NSTYLHLWMGNNPRATGGPQDDHTMILALAQTREEQDSITAGWLAKMEQPERSRALAEPTLRQVQDAPLDTLTRRLWAGLCFFFGEDFLTQKKLWREVTYLEDGQSVDQSNGEYPLLLTASLLGMLLLGAIGW